MKRLSYILPFALLFVVTGCKVGEMMEPNVPPTIFIGSTNNDETKPDQTVSFAYNRADLNNVLLYVNVNYAGDSFTTATQLPIRQRTPRLKEGETLQEVLKRQAIPLPHDRDLLETRAYIGHTYHELLPDGSGFSEEQKVVMETVGGSGKYLDPVTGQERDFVQADYVGFDHPRLMEFLKNYDTYKIGNRRHDGFASLGDNQNTHFLPGPRGTLSFPLILLRDPALRELEKNPELEDKQKELHMEIYSSKALTTGDTTRLRYYVTFSDYFGKPSNWDQVNLASTEYWDRLFGSWSSVKMRIIIEGTGFSNWELKNPVELFPWGVRAAYMKTKAAQRARYIREFRPSPYEFDSNGDILDENGAKVLL